ncbi:MAG: hypothetical protein EBT62_07520 [Opitutaceae bacterium]|nr:hypothetical protein [Opitutaceae bacterium]
MNPGAGSPDLIEPAGPTDPTASFIFLREPNGKPIALFSSYSLHYVGGVDNGDISSDYYGVYCEKLKELLSPQNNSFVALMANGTSGDINNINFKTPRGRQKPYEQMTIVANDLATKVAALAAVAAVFVAVPPVTQPPQPKPTTASAMAPMTAPHT